MIAEKRKNVRYRTPVARNGRGIGSVKLEIPIAWLLSQFVLDFLGRTLKRLRQGAKMPDPAAFLEEHGIGPETLRLAGVADMVSPAPLKWNGTLKDANKLCRIVQDLIDDDGAWRELRHELTDAGKDFVEQFCHTLRAAVEAALRDYGLRAAMRIMKHINEQLQQSRQACVRTAASSRAPLKSVSEPLARVQRFLKRPGWKLRLLSLFWRGRSIKFAVDSRHQRAIQSLKRSGEELQDARFTSLARTMQLDLFDRLLGSGRGPGVLDSIADEVEEQAAMFGSLAIAIHADTEEQPKPSATRVLLVDRLNCVIGQDADRTLLDEFYSRARQAGCTTSLFARILRGEGIRTKKGALLPHQWHERDPARILKRLVRMTAQYLGCDDESRQLQPLDPQTAADFCAQLHLMHPLLQPRLLQQLPVVTERSAPYAEFDGLSGVEQLKPVFLFCYPGHRAKLIQLLSRQVQSIAEHEGSKKYGLRHPYELIVLQHQLAAPVGAMRNLHRWSVLSARAERKGRVVRHEPRGRHLEVRILRSRTRCTQDCEVLLEAGEKAGLITRVGKSKHFALTQDDHRFEAMFAPPQWETIAVPASRFHELLQNHDSLASFLIHQFSTHPQLRVVLARLRKEHDPSVVARELVARKVLQQDGDRYAINARLASNPRHAPRELVRQVPGPLVGLTKETFTTQLYDNDLLYSVLFFGVIDAWQLQWISENDTPASVIDYVQTLI